MINLGEAQESWEDGVEELSDTKLSDAKLSDTKLAGPKLAAQHIWEFSRA